MGVNQARGRWGAGPSPSRVYLPCQHPWPSEHTNTRVCFASVRAALAWLTNSLSPFFWDYVFEQPARTGSELSRPPAAGRDAPSPQPLSPGPAAGLPPLTPAPTKHQSFFPRQVSEKTFVRSDLQLDAGSFPLRA